MHIGYALSTVALAVQGLLAPSLQLDFLSGTLDPRVTFTRASSATYFGIDGLLKTAANDVPRFDYDPSVPAGVDGTELVGNGDFSSGLSGWIASSSNLSIVGGRLRVSGSGTYGYGYRSFATTPGKTYRLLAKVGTSTAGAANVRFRTGSSVGDGGYIDATPASDEATINSMFVAGATLTYITLVDRTADSSSYAEFVSVSIQEVVFTPRGLLIEEARTNLLLWSRDMTQAAWSKTDVTPTAAVGIDGVAVSADLMTEGSAGNALLTQSGAISAGTVTTLSFVLKRGNTDWVRVLIDEGAAADQVRAWFNLATGAKGSLTVAGAATQATSTITPLGGGWNRCTVTGLPNATTTSVRAALTSASADASTTRVPGATYTVDCAQLEVGAFATSIIPTTTATVNRAGDVASMTGTAFSDWYSQTQGTFIAEFDRPAISPVALAYNQLIVAATSAAGTGNSLVGILCGSSAPAAQRFDVTNGGVVQASLNYSGSATTNTVYKAAGAYLAGDCIGALDGVLTASDTVNTIPTNDRLYLGHNVGSSQGASHIRRLTYYNRRIPNVELQSLTT